jgi:uncharacterized protein involved in response to NO
VSPTAKRTREYEGPAFLSYGFRPFFLGAAAWAALAMAVWLGVIAGGWKLPITLRATDWHVHELLYGFLPAAAAGFLLTAIPNWTDRLPVTGRPLLALFSVWLAGRAAMVSSAATGPWAAALIDLAFLALLLAAIAREIIAGRNTRNLPVVVLVALMLIGNGVFHVEAARTGGASHGIRIGIAAGLLLIMLIGGRIVPSFTRNWLSRQAPGRLPANFARFDAIAVAAGAVALAAWVGWPRSEPTAALCLAAAVLHGVRLARWAGDRTGAERLVLILHVAYAFVPLGFLLVAAGIAAPQWVLPGAALHAWTAGAIGLMVLAVMTRASLGHCGWPLTATRPIEAIYASGIVAALARVAAGIGIAPAAMLHVAAAAWIACFMGFVVVYGPMLTTPRRRS